IPFGKNRALPRLHCKRLHKGLNYARISGQPLLFGWRWMVSRIGRPCQMLFYEGQIELALSAVDGVPFS
ncbi:MAG: hypothetical protein KC964_31300, partial [Candidatus Omnitrophica bacterium]|nr:hypothetical protein [Candidatus Omnitrophota bacterium]